MRASAPASAPGEHQPDRDRLAVQQLVPADRLERVGKRVPEVEGGADAGALLGVGRDHPWP